MFNISELWKIGNCDLLFYIGVMTRFAHPNLRDVPLASVLHALSDPARLEIVRSLDADLKERGEGLACNCAAPEGLPRATVSNHFTILRGAGLIEGRKEGTKLIHRLRRAEIDKRFPGLLDAVLHAEAQS
jgi:DNA-binding transcriptional ArsR family regulator